jgi:5'-nucleotidase
VQSQPGGINECNGISGPIVDIVGRTTNAVDLFVTGHPLGVQLRDRRPPGHERGSFGRLVTDIDLALDRRSRDVVEVAANNMIVTQNVFKAGDITQLIERYNAIAAPLRDRVIGRISADITQTPDDFGGECRRQPDRRRRSGSRARERRTRCRGLRSAGLWWTRRRATGSR